MCVMSMLFRCRSMQSINLPDIATMVNVTGRWTHTKSDARRCEQIKSIIFRLSGPKV